MIIKQTLLWIMIMIVIVTLNLFLMKFTWQFNQFLSLDILTAVMLGITISYLSSVIKKAKNIQVRIISLSLIVTLVVMPFLLHYALLINLLSIVAGNIPSPLSIYLKSLVLAFKNSVLVFILAYPVVALIFFAKKRYWHRGGYA